VSLTSPLDFIFESTLHLAFPSLSLSLVFKGYNTEDERRRRQILFRQDTKLVYKIFSYFLLLKEEEEEEDPK
jgi:hypothetical protein